MPRPIRRVVTGHTPDGRATILQDGPAPQVSPGAAPGAGSTVLWVTDRAPASNAGDADMAPGGETIPIAPRARGGTVFRIVDFMPGVASRFTESSGVQQTADRSARHAGFHKTDTVDYAIVLEGEIWAVLDDAETLLRAGDVLIQRGTFHAWDNRSTAVCRIAFVLIDAEPV
jgi:hypothetical protein